MPIFTGTILAWSPSLTKTTSIGLALSFFLSPFALFVGVKLEEFVALASVLVPADREFVLESFGALLVTLANGTVSAFVRERVSISAVTDMPGRNASFSSIRIFT